MLHLIPSLRLNKARMYEILSDNGNDNDSENEMIKKYISTHLMSSVHVAEIGINRYYGFELDNNHRFVMGDFTVSHNSALIKSIRHNLGVKHNKLVAITSLTGISANIIGGMTLHSYLGIRLGTGSYKKLLEMVTSNKKIYTRWRRTDTLIIDEVSMLSIELFEKLEKIARVVRCIDKPFGGIQIILTGDFCQLGSVELSGFLFESELWNKCIDRTIYLTQNMRQSEELFSRVLSKIRINIIDDEVIELLKSRAIKYHSDVGLIPTMLYAINSKVDRTNNTYYSKLTTEEFTFELTYNWKANVNKEKYDKLLRFENTLSLKVGAQVMHLINDGNLFN